MDELRNKILTGIDTLYHTPDLLQDNSLNYLDLALDGKLDIVDVSTPFMFLLESSCVNTHGAILKSQTVAREIYPELATEYSHLYNHMADADYLDRFATPSRTVITLVIPVRSFENNGILDPVTNTRKLVIPKDTMFKVGGYAWYVHRPIVVTQAANKVIQVNYDLSVTSPLINTATNLLDFTTVNVEGSTQLLIRIPVEQIEVTSTNHSVNSSTGFSVTIPFTDQFYCVRAYQKSTNTVWSEMNVTHSDQVYDPTLPTLRAIVVEGGVKLQLPEIYMTQGNVGESIRIDLHTTKGVVEVDLSDYSPDDFEGQWRDIGNPTDPFIAVISNINDLSVFAADPVISGRDELSFAALRERVIYRSGDKAVNVTFEELGFEMNDRGYTLTRGKDTVTGRQYICSRSLPAPTGKVTTPIGVRHARTTVDTDRTDVSVSVINNGIRKTITNRAIFKEAGSVVELATDAEIDALNNMTPEALAVHLNSNKYYYTPFIYVLDPEESLYSIRTYHISRPKEITRSFVANNPALPFAVNTKSVSVTRIGDTFQITFRAEGPSGITGLHAQLVYTDVSGRKYRMNADQTPVADSAKLFDFTFNLNTTLDISTEDRIEITSMTGPTNSVESVYMELISDFDLYYIKDMTYTVTPATFQNEFDRSAFGVVVGATHETCQLQFGQQLINLATRAKATILSPTVQRYAEAVPLTYPKDVWERDADDIPVWSVDPVSGRPVFNKLHSAGDLWLDDGGNVQYVHEAGDVVLDAAGNPTYESEERLIWEVEPLLLDAKWRFATSQAAYAYRADIADVILGYLEQDINALSPELMTRTSLVFQPTASVGVVPVNVDGRVTIPMETALRFKVNYMLEPGAYEDNALRKSLTASTKTVIVASLAKSIFSLSDLITRLRNNGGEYIVDVRVDNPIQGYNVGILLPENTKFSIFSELVSLTNGTLDVEDAVEVTFTRRVDE